MGPGGELAGKRDRHSRFWRCPLLVVGEAGNAHDGLRLITRLQPNVAIIDISMPGANGIDLTAVLRQEAPSVSIIILTGRSESDFAEQVLQLGVASYLTKHVTVADLERAIRAAAVANCYMRPQSASCIVNGIPLTARHHEVLDLICEGKSNKEIATMLSVSVKTVEKHRNELMRRIGAHNTAAIVRYAILRRSLLTQETAYPSI